MVVVQYGQQAKGQCADSKRAAETGDKMEHTVLRWQQLSLDNFDVQEDIVMHIVGVIMAQQYTIRKGLKLLGDGGRLAVKKELTQLHDMAMYTSMHVHELTWEQRVQAL